MARLGCGTDLATRSQRTTLVAGASGVQLLNAEAPAAAWRLVEIFGDAPFEADLSWTSGNGQGAGATLTVPRSSRVCVYARSLDVRVTNRSAGANSIGCNVVDPGVYVHGDHILAVTPAPAHFATQSISTVAIPRFARAFRIQVGEYASLPTASIQVLDGAGNVLVSMSLADFVAAQLNAPLDLTDVASIVVTWPDDPDDGPVVPVHRFVFYLSI